jgi:hypothetical protein
VLVVLAAVAISAGVDALQRRRARDTVTEPEASAAETVAVGAGPTGDRG